MRGLHAELTQVRQRRDPARRNASGRPAAAIAVRNPCAILPRLLRGLACTEHIRQEERRRARSQGRTRGCAADARRGVIDRRTSPVADGVGRPTRALFRASLRWRRQLEQHGQHAGPAAMHKYSQHHHHHGGLPVVAQNQCRSTSCRLFSAKANSMKTGETSYNQFRCAWCRIEGR